MQMPLRLTWQTWLWRRRRFTPARINRLCPERYATPRRTAGVGSSFGARFARPVIIEPCQKLITCWRSATRRALRCRRAGEQTFNHDIGYYRIPPLIQLPALMNAAAAVQTDTETAEDLKLLLNEGSPLGGARPKSALAVWRLPNFQNLTMVAVSPTAKCWP